jgi:hypothetical protein
MNDAELKITTLQEALRSEHIGRVVTWSSNDPWAEHQRREGPARCTICALIVDLPGAVTERNKALVTETRINLLDELAEEIEGLEIDEHEDPAIQNGWQRAKSQVLRLLDAK